MVATKESFNIQCWSTSAYKKETMLHGDRFRPRKPPFLHILEYVATDSGLVSPSPLVEVIAPDEKIDHSHSAVPQPASPPHFLARQERWIDLRSRRNSFHTAFQALQDLTQLVELTKNWRVHAKKTQEFYLEHWTVSIRFVGAELVAQSAYQTASKRYETTCSKIGTTITC